MATIRKQFTVKPGQSKTVRAGGVTLKVSVKRGRR